MVVLQERNTTDHSLVRVSILLIQSAGLTLIGRKTASTEGLLCTQHHPDQGECCLLKKGPRRHVIWVLTPMHSIIVSNSKIADWSADHHDVEILCNAQRWHCLRGPQSNQVRFSSETLGLAYG